MIQEHHDHIDDEFRVSVPVVHPWTPYPVCRACGHVLGAHLWGIRRFFWAKGNAAQNYAYCKGSHNSTFQAAGLRIGTEGPQIVQQDLPVTCFGIFDEHLHLACGRCGFVWLMAVKGGK